MAGVANSGKIRLVVFDFDGTLVEMHGKSAWRMIDSALGCEDADKEISQRHFSGKTTVAQWSQETVEDLYKKFGLTRGKLEQIVNEEMRPITGAVEALKELRRLGIRTAIVSGSIANIYDFAKKKWGIEADMTSFECEIFFDSDGAIRGGSYNEFDFEGKALKVEQMANELGINLSEVAMVGDSGNDVFAFRTVGLPIAFNSDDPELEKAASHVIMENDLREVIKLVLKHKVRSVGGL
jgi:HAD superfamily phosphoserine phosphatase-like hydrolase